MEDAIEGGFRTETREDVVVTCEKRQLLEVHVFVRAADILRVQVLKGAEQFAHEVDHNATVNQVYQLAYLATVHLFSLGYLVVEWQDEVLNKILH